MYENEEWILVEKAAVVPLNYGRLRLLVKRWVSKNRLSIPFLWLRKDITLAMH
jgi:hypothetical protein